MPLHTAMPCRNAYNNFGGRSNYMVSREALPFCYASTVFLPKSVPFLAVCL
eukprot:SAG22_NODE_7277_length_755_cov_1.236280_2_plen_51_part_00